MIYLADAVLNIRTVSKELKLTGKEVTEKLAEYGHEIKSATAEITPEQASLILDIFTLQNETEKEELSAEDEELFEKWGVANKEDLDFLENEYHEWATSYEIDSKAMVDSVKQLCLIELDIRKARKKSDVLALDKLLRIKSQILGDANLKPVQETGNAANEQVSIGMLIKKFEQEEPIPEDTEPDWIDEMKIWIVGQLARMEGLQSDVTDDFNKELNTYGIDVEKELGDE